jgi:hypothetical protein
MQTLIEDEASMTESGKNLRVLKRTGPIDHRRSLRYENSSLHTFHRLLGTLHFLRESSASSTTALILHSAGFAIKGGRKFVIR